MAKDILELSHNVQQKLEDISRKMGGGSVSIGFMEGATYPDGTSVPTVAFLNEFGHAGPHPAPPRPFFRNMIADHQDEWPQQMAKAALAANYNGKRVLGIMGEVIKGELQQSINSLDEPPLSPVTVAKKGFDKPLIDTSHMVNSVVYAVDNGHADGGE